MAAAIDFEMAMSVLLIFGSYLAIASLFTGFAFWLDKRRAQLGEWRVPESTLLLLALLGGSPGAKFAQRRFRHKTRKEPFRTLLDAIVVVHCLAIGGLAAGIYLGFSPVWRMVEIVQYAGAAVFSEDRSAEPKSGPLPRRFGPGL